MKKRKNIVILTGAGISAESGISTFRDANGLWEKHKVEDVASPDGWRRDRELVLRFYNERRAKLNEVKPNDGHLALVELEKKFNVCIITQNIDDLHERAGSKRIVHLHGELKKMRSSLDDKLIYDCEGDINVGDKCEKGSQLRPHIVWFGEGVPMMDVAAQLTQVADIIIVVGTSLKVYPAAGLLMYSNPDIPKYYIDPYPAAEASKVSNLTIIKEPASTGVGKLVKVLLEHA